MYFLDILKDLLKETQFLNEEASQNTSFNSS